MATVRAVVPHQPALHRHTEVWTPSMMLVEDDVLPEGNSYTSEFSFLETELLKICIF